MLFFCFTVKMTYRTCTNMNCDFQISVTFLSYFFIATSFSSMTILGNAKYFFFFFLMLSLKTFFSLQAFCYIRPTFYDVLGMYDRKLLKSIWHVYKNCKSICIAAKCFECLKIQARNSVTNSSKKSNSKSDFSWVHCVA